MRKQKSSGAKRQVRYAVVGLGHIAQVAVLPGFKNPPNSRLTALVSGSAKKMAELAVRYGIAHTYSYEQYDECLRSGEIDAVFIALPNHLHADYSIRAARAGIHVLCEKPLAATRRECERMIQAARQNEVRLMTAYRLHFEEANLRAIELVKSGRIGEPRYFNSAFSFNLPDASNPRFADLPGAGTLHDVGVYCINAVRHLFQDEPAEVSALCGSRKDPRFRHADEMTSAILRFPGGRIATFTNSFGAAFRNYFEVVGTEGFLRLDPAFGYSEKLAWRLSAGGKEEIRKFAPSDHFGAQFSYFSDCILNGREPEPSGEEGLIDVAIVEALYRSARTGRVVKIGALPQVRRPTLDQAIRFPPVPRAEKLKP